MATITIKEPEGPYSATIDTGVMDVVLKQTFIGVTFVTEEGKELHVSMRDGGYEIYCPEDTYLNVRRKA